MRTRAKLALGIVTGGIALGAMLGAAADPEPKRPPAPPWRAAQAAYYADAGYQLAEAPPQDLGRYRDSYAPSWADEEVADWEPEYPAWTYSDLPQEAESAPDERPADAVPPPDQPAEPLAAEPQIEGAIDALY